MTTEKVSFPDSNWEPNEADKLKAEEAYIRYIAGVAMLHDPHRMQTISGRDPSQIEQRMDIVVHAKSLIWSGLNEVIRYANHPAIRNVEDMEKSYESAFPHMKNTRDNAMDSHGEKLEDILPDVGIFRPLPVLTAQPIYSSVIYPRKDKIFVRQVMGVWNTDSNFEPNLWVQDFTDVPKGTEPLSSPRIKAV